MFHVQHAPEASFIEVGDDLDAFTSPALNNAIELAESGSSQVVVSLEHCAYCDSRALGILIRAKKRLGERLIIFVPKDVMVRRIFEYRLSSSAEHKRQTARLASPSAV